MYAISCFHVFLSLFRLSGRRHENTKYARWNNDILTGEGTKISLLKISCRRVEIFRVVALCLSCLRVFTSKREGRNNDKKTCFEFSLLSWFRLSGWRHENTKYVRRKNNILTGEGHHILLMLKLAWEWNTHMRRKKLWVTSLENKTIY